MNLQSKNFPSRSKKEQLIDSDLQQLETAINGIIETPVDSADVSYDNTISGLDATNVKTAIDKLTELSSGSEYTETIVNISSAQILDMGSTPIELLPAAGVGKYYDWYGFLESTHVTTAYTNPAYLTIETSDNLVLQTLADTILSGGVNSFAKLNVSTSDGNITYESNLNLGIRLSTQDGSNPTLGDGTLRVKIYHKTITFGA